MELEREVQWEDWCFVTNSDPLWHWGVRQVLFYKNMESVAFSVLGQFETVVQCSVGWACACLKSQG